jgi:acid stress-induced BolA-like protein IbaG/YrbA
MAALIALAGPAARLYISPEQQETRMPMDAQDIEALILASFPNARVSVQGDDGAHFAAEVIDESFRGLNRVQQQRAVYAALKGKMDGAQGELHALALTTKVPE